MLVEKTKTGTVSFRIPELSMLCKSILNANRKICSVSIINNSGRPQEIMNRSGIVPCLSSEKKEIFYMEYALRDMMRREFDEELGPVRYSYTERRNETLFSFPLDSLLVIVTCHQSVNPATFANKIIPMISACKTKIHDQLTYTINSINNIQKEKPMDIMT